MEIQKAPLQQPETPADDIVECSIQDIFPEGLESYFEEYENQQGGLLAPITHATHSIINQHATPSTVDPLVTPDSMREDQIDGGADQEGEGYFAAAPVDQGEGGNDDSNDRGVKLEEELPPAAGPVQPAQPALLPLLESRRGSPSPLVLDAVEIEKEDVQKIDGGILGKSPTVWGKDVEARLLDTEKKVGNEVSVKERKEKVDSARGEMQGKVQELIKDAEKRGSKQGLIKEVDIVKKEPGSFMQDDPGVEASEQSAVLSHEYSTPMRPVEDDGGCLGMLRRQRGGGRGSKCVIL